MPDQELEPLLEAVGPRLREARNGRNLKLAEVAEQTGISVSTLSRLESGLRRPSLDLLIPLARTYRVPLDDLVGAPPSGDPRIHPRPVRRHGMVYIPLTGHGAPVQAFKMVLPGRRPDAPIEQGVHGGYEWIYVLGGTLHLKVGSHITTLATGEAAEFDTRTPHGMASAGPDPVEILSLFSPQGEQIHIRDA
ncbi:helix-turn-helix domain-containing protein [Plantactinospora sp. S1510]|uniref:Helix-turn-helix domain-containing protein n=1 Tax=Plantactinospora alkalitolerans TaxID=2789879 RepID=A0ABS0GTK5_9ACTN|nr:XRE family transcriptional regulator [Plantactinospora alkalitolerans]MBF9129529.1 helix-turn-helix domain-containing protein [Plantactinospora alkalitolerans]